MIGSLRIVLRSLVILGGAVAVAAGLLGFSAADWPIYLVYFLLSIPIVVPHVRVLPGLALAIPDLATTIGFLYIGGLPLIPIRIFTPILVRSVFTLLPKRWERQWPLVRAVARAVRQGLFWERWELETRGIAGGFTEWGTTAIGLGVRWLIVTAIAGDGLPSANPGAIAVAELGGYVCWGLLALLPIYPDRRLLPLASEKGGLRAALADIGFIVVLAVTPFVLLITYGFQAHGLSGAAAWSLSSLGLHFMLKRLNERRLIVEEQNRRLEILNRELEHRERLSAIGKMSSVVSHQILHQLGVIGIYADLIRNADGESGPEPILAQARENARAIEDALRNVNRVLTDLLVFSKDLRLNLYEHPLRRVIEECIEDCQAVAGERGVKLRCECAEEASVVLDKLKMKQAITNVLRNAIEVSPSGAEVLVRGGVRDGFAEVVVSDRGPGVPERDREAIFTPFFTTKEHGTGLGLAIAREFTEAHGGTLVFRPTVEQAGATFVFRLPLERS